MCKNNALCRRTFMVFRLILLILLYPQILSKLQTLQNKAVKIIGGDKYMDHATTFYSKLKILKIPELYKHKVAKLVFYHYHQRLPPLLSNLYVKTNQVSQRCTRSSSTVNNPTLYIPLYKTIRLQKSIRYQGVKIWNEIPTSIKGGESSSQFRWFTIA